jgi:hypothetical protein
MINCDKLKISVLKLISFSTLCLEVLSRINFKTRNQRKCKCHLPYTIVRWYFHATFIASWQKSGTVQ